MNNIQAIRTKLEQAPKLSLLANAGYFKTQPGHYAEHDCFIGVPVPVLRVLAKEYKDCSLAEMRELINSPINEERLLALLILVHQYEKANPDFKQTLYNFYMDQRLQVNNWNLVDASAPAMVGEYLFDKNREVLLELVQSSSLWERRIAIVATLYFIRHNDLDWTFKLAELLLHDKHDLIHKATGWMLREAGKKDMQQLTDFLYQYGPKMPRTMLRYAIEKFPEQQRKMMLAL